MQSKIIFLILFMLSFTVMHDTVINIIGDDEHMSISHYIDDNSQSKECSNVHEVHNMCHFVGLIIPNKNTFMQVQKEVTLSHNLLPHIFQYKEISFKPPRV